MSNQSARPNSIQASNLDLTALGDALTDSPVEDSTRTGGRHQVEEAEPYALGDDEDAEAEEEALKKQEEDREKAPDKQAVQGKDSPETLSPDTSPRKRDSEPSPNEGASPGHQGSSVTMADQLAKSGNDSTSMTTEARKSPTMNQSQSQSQSRGNSRDPSQIEAIKSIFPDLDSETISAVLVTTNGDVDAAIDHLLSMSDPNYVPPPPSETDSDAALARSLAAEQEQSLTQASNRNTNRTFGRGGNQQSSLGGWFGGQPQQQQQQQQPAYNPNALNYQPRQRKTPPPPIARAAYNAPPITSQDMDHNPLIAGFPGSNEAKQWEESINKFAETGMAKAASTFAALRTRAAALASPTSEGGSSNNVNNPGGVSSSSPGSGAGSFFSQFGLSGGNQNTNSSYSSSIGSFNRKQSQTRSPQSPYDNDPEPVGEDELARILARGQASRSSTSSTSSSIGLGTGRGSSSGTGRSQWRNKQEIEDDVDDDDDDLWGGAGKVIDKKKKKLAGTEIASQKSDAAAKKEGFKPIEIRGAPSEERNQSLAPNQRAASHERDDSDENDSDVEYVANPFEEDD